MSNDSKKSADQFEYLSKMKAFFNQKETPLWVTLVLLSLTALGTYLIAPAINRSVQLDNSRSEHLKSTIDSLNDETILLFVSLRKFQDELGDRNAEHNARDDVLDNITRIQWRRVSAEIIYRDEPQLRIASQKMSGAILKLRQDVIAAKTLADAAAINASAQRYGETARDMLELLYLKSGLSPSDSSDVEHGD